MSLLRRRIAGKLQVGAFNFVPGYERGLHRQQRETARLIRTHFLNCQLMSVAQARLTNGYCMWQAFYKVGISGGRLKSEISNTK